MTNRKIAANLGVNTTTVWRTVKLFRETGDVQQRTHPVAEFIIVSEVLKHPGIMLL